MDNSFIFAIFFNVFLILLSAYGFFSGNIILSIIFVVLMILNASFLVYKCTGNFKNNSR
ncbi:MULTISPECIES: hypothetical protein [unclassified Mammaliicoccus]|uniref:hypothetical protein n=1 Tax=unclassified Mammaliicoccus TaxID=2803851 RepID=UPI001EFACC65|nr:MULTISPECIES: hypothetical protein [unclassified Mammaliicoccus]